jgi:hypothetical protein
MCWMIEELIWFLAEADSLFSTASQPALEITQPSTQWVPEAILPWVKWAGHEADYSLPFRAMVKNVLSYISTPQHTSIAQSLLKNRDLSSPLKIGILHTYYFPIKSVMTLQLSCQILPNSPVLNPSEYHTWNKVKTVHVQKSQRIAEEY